MTPIAVMCSAAVPRITRRAFNAAIPLIPAAFAGSARDARAASAEPLRATVVLEGATFEYEEASGRNLGNYVDPAGRFTMSCVRVTRSDCPLRVDFRRIPGWACVIFELGDAFSASPKNLRPYTASIAGRTISLPGHWWGSRWRWHSGPWPLPMVPVEELAAKKLIAAFDPLVPQGTANPGSGSITYAPLALAGLTGYMPMTGERADIGYVTDVQADYICKPTPQRLANVLAQGEAGATIPWRYYDPKTGTTIDALIEYPHAPDSPRIASEPLASFEVVVSGAPGTVIPAEQLFTVTNGNTINQNSHVVGGTLPAGGSMRMGAWEDGHASVDPTGLRFAGLPAGVTATLVPGSFLGASGVQPDAAHEPACSYLPFILTGDPYFLENLHCQAMYAFLETTRGYDNVLFPGAIQTRSMAWNLRSIMEAAAVTPADVPPWLLSRNVTQAALQFCLNGINKAIKGDNPSQTVFHSAGLSRNWKERGFWQDDFFALVCGATVLLHPEWTPVLQWHIQNLIARLDGKSGWCNGSPDPYIVVTIGEDGKWYRSWAEAWAANNGGKSACTPLSAAQPPRGQADYMNGMRAALAAATQALSSSDPVRAQVQAALDILEPPLFAWLSKRASVMEYKWAVKRIKP